LLIVAVSKITSKIIDEPIKVFITEKTAVLLLALINPKDRNAHYSGLLELRDYKIEIEQKWV